MWNVWFKKYTYNDVQNAFDKNGRGRLIQEYCIKQGHGIDVSDKWRQYIIGAMIENQSQFNTSMIGEPDNEAFSKLSIGSTARIWATSIIPDIVSVQPMLGPQLAVWYRIGKKIESQEIFSKSRMLRHRRYLETHNNIRTNDLAKDLMEYDISTATTEIKNEQQREVFTDIRNNSDTIGSGFCFEEALEKTYNALCKKLKNYYREDIKPNWMVKSPDEGYSGTTDVFKATATVNGVEQYKKINGMTVYIDPRFPADTAIMGYKGSEIDSSYIFAPFVPLIPTFVSLDPDMLCPRKGLMTRYAKKLIRSGSQCFARMHWGPRYVKNNTKNK